MPLAPGWKQKALKGRGDPLTLIAVLCDAAWSNVSPEPHRLTARLLAAATTASGVATCGELFEAAVSLHVAFKLTAASTSPGLAPPALRWPQCVLLSEGLGQRLANTRALGQQLVALQPADRFCR